MLGSEARRLGLEVESTVGKERSTLAGAGAVELWWRRGFRFRESAGWLIDWGGLEVRGLWLGLDLGELGLELLNLFLLLGDKGFPVGLLGLEVVRHGQARIEVAEKVDLGLGRVTRLGLGAKTEEKWNKMF